MKTFWKDYGELCNMNSEFMRKHWKGCLVLSAAISATTYVIVSAAELISQNFRKIGRKEDKD